MNSDSPFDWHVKHVIGNSTFYFLDGLMLEIRQIVRLSCGEKEAATLHVLR